MKISFIKNFIFLNLFLIIFSYGPLVSAYPADYSHNIHGENSDKVNKFYKSPAYTDIVKISGVFSREIEVSNRMEILNGWFDYSTIASKSFKLECPVEYPSFTQKLSRFIVLQEGVNQFFVVQSTLSSDLAEFKTTY